MVANQQDEYFMQLALEQAALAAEAGEIPVGAVVVKDGQVIGLGHNASIATSDPTAHAEVVALRAAASAIGNYRLEDCTLYVTLEPCAMCCGAMLHGRIRRVVFGAPDEKTGCAGSVINLFSESLLNHQTRVEGGLLASQSTLTLQSFFKPKRLLQRAQSMRLREDALRTPEQRFATLAPLDWQAQYISDLPVLDGLQLHYWDAGPRDATDVVLCLHSVPGWSYLHRHQIATWVREGKRVVAPDLIGFGKSDKPKRATFHSVGFHVQSLIELLSQLHLSGVKLAAWGAPHPLSQPLLSHNSGLISTRFEPAEIGAEGSSASQEERDAPHPDAGHRAAERAFAARSFC